MNALELFREGHDYIKIGWILGFDYTFGKNAEAEVEKIIHRLRQEEIDAKEKQKREARLEQQRARYRRNRDELRQIRRQHG